jgi:hypothetical protein
METNNKTTCGDDHTADALFVVWDTGIKKGDPKTASQ